METKIEPIAARGGLPNTRHACGYGSDMSQLFSPVGLDLSIQTEQAANAPE